MKKLFVLILLTGILAGCGNSAQAITIEEAEKIALEEVNGEVVKAKKDKDDGVDYYDFDIITDTEKYNVEIKADDGKVIKVEKDDDYNPPVNNTQSDTNNNGGNTTTDPGTTQDTTTNNQVTITAERAQEIAMERVGTGTLVKCELEYEDDHHRYEYDIEIVDGHIEYDLEIDATTGEILKYEQD